MFQPSDPHHVKDRSEDTNIVHNVVDSEQNSFVFAVTVKTFWCARILLLFTL